MRTLDNDIRELTGTSRTGLNYLSFEPLRIEHLNDLPALRIRVDSISKDTSKTYTAIFQLFFPYPQGCNTFEEAIEASKDIADTNSKMLEELIRTGLGQHKGYEVTGALIERVFNGQAVTEHKVIALQVTATLTITYNFECCNEGTYFNFDEYVAITNPWGR